MATPQLRNPGNLSAIQLAHQKAAQAAQQQAKGGQSSAPQQPGPVKKGEQPGNWKQGERKDPQKNVGGRTEIGGRREAEFRPRTEQTPEQIKEIHNLADKLVSALHSCEIVIDSLMLLEGGGEKFERDRAKLLTRAEALDGGLLRGKGPSLDELLQMKIAVRKLALDIVRVTRITNARPNDKEVRESYNESLADVRRFAIESEISGQRELAPESVQEGNPLLRETGIKILRPGVFIKPALLKGLEELRSNDLAANMEMFSVANLQQRKENFIIDTEESIKSIRGVKEEGKSTNNDSWTIEDVREMVRTPGGVEAVSEMDASDLKKLLENVQERRAINRKTIEKFKALLRTSIEYEKKFRHLDTSTRQLLTSEEQKLIATFEYEKEGARDLIKEIVTRAEQGDKDYADLEEEISAAIETMEVAVADPTITPTVSPTDTPTAAAPAEPAIAPIADPVATPAVDPAPDTTSMIPVADPTATPVAEPASLEGETLEAMTPDVYEKIFALHLDKKEITPAEVVEKLLAEGIVAPEQDVADYLELLNLAE